MLMRFLLGLSLHIVVSSSGFSLGIGCDAPKDGQAMVISMASDTFTQFAIHDTRMNGKVAKAFEPLLQEGITRADLRIALDVTQCERHNLDGKGEFLNCGAEAVIGPVLINKCGQAEYDKPGSMYYICHQMLEKYAPSVLRINAAEAGFRFTAVIPNVDQADSDSLPFSVTVATQNPKIMATWNFAYGQSGTRCHTSEGQQY